MALKNTKLTKVGSTSTNSAGNSNSGHSQSCVVIPANPLPQPAAWGGDSKESISAYQQRLQLYVQSITPDLKFSQDNE